ncbi:MAG TPA: isoleucine--tRNA ligase, partial [Gammaproteobacteria bacterium]|nr:isoleucine--tRNA ligase [Gammaproteobacteria bacterium]
NTLWNTYAFFTLYASIDDIDLDDKVTLADRPEIDRWALALTHHTVRTVTEAMDAYDARGAGQALENFVDQLSNWYIRRNRRRFWKSEAGTDKQSAYLTLYQCLDALQRLIAPFMPFLAEAMYQNLVCSRDRTAPISVHMSEWPEVPDVWQDTALRKATEVIQHIVALGRAARETSQVRVRQPLARLLVRVPTEEAR